VITFKVAFSSVTFGVFDSNCQGLLPFISHWALRSVTGIWLTVPSLIVLSAS
jgi:hypothetical protein